MDESRADEVVPTLDGTTTRGAIGAQVRVVAPGVVELRELPNGTPETTAVVGDYLQDAIVDWKRFVLVVDLKQVEHRPKAEYRDAIRKLLGELPVANVVFVPPRTKVPKVFLQFIMRRMVTVECFVLGSVDEAHAKAKELASSLEL